MPNEHGHTYICGTGGSHGDQSSEEPLYCLPKWLHGFAFPPAMYKAQISLHSYPHLLFSVVIFLGGMLAIVLTVPWIAFLLY